MVYFFPASLFASAMHWASALAMRHRLWHRHWVLLTGHWRNQPNSVMRCHCNIGKGGIFVGGGFLQKRSKIDSPSFHIRYPIFNILRCSQKKKRGKTRHDRPQRVLLPAAVSPTGPSIFFKKKIKIVTEKEVRTRMEKNMYGYHTIQYRLCGVWTVLF